MPVICLLCSCPLGSAFEHQGVVLGAEGLLHVPTCSQAGDAVLAPLPHVRHGGTAVILGGEESKVAAIGQPQLGVPRAGKNVFVI